MSQVPKNKANTSVLYREGPPDYLKLAAEAFPTPQLIEAGSICEDTDTGDRFRWNGTNWFIIGGPRVQSVTIVETALTAATVDGSFEFTLDGNAPRNNILEYFYFVNGGGTPVDATAGTVVVTLSPILPLYQDITAGSFNADTARNATWAKPNGFGKAVSIKIVLAGVTGDPTGFRGLVSQSVS